MRPAQGPADGGGGGGGGAGTGPVLTHTYSGKLHAFLKSRTGQAPPRIEASPAEGKAARAMRKQIEELARAHESEAKTNAASSSKDVGEVREAAEGFRDLSKGSERAIQFLCDAGGLIALLQMLGPGADEAATEHAVLTILNLSLSNKSIANRFLVSGALISLSSVLTRSHNPSIRSNTAAAITALVARGGTAQVPSLHKQGTVRALLDLAEESGEGSDGRHDALRALARLAGSEAVREEMVEEGGVELALRLAVSGDVDVLDEVAALLAQLGRTGSGLRRIYSFRAQGKGAGAGEGEEEAQGEGRGGGDEECRAAVVAAEGTLLPHLEEMAGDDSSQRLQTKAKGLANALGHS
ncbi:unnamed protein product [Closterium sp. Yama58-4]|nr:unnamed protein product [Closterium sp. Yama58-4]